VRVWSEGLASDDDALAVSHPRGQVQARIIAAWAQAAGALDGVFDPRRRRQIVRAGLGHLADHGHSNR